MKEIYGGYEQPEEILVTQSAGTMKWFAAYIESIRRDHMLPYGRHTSLSPEERDRRPVEITGCSTCMRDGSRCRRLAQQVATELQRILRPKGVAVMMEGKHQCMCCRGVRKQEGTMVTSCLLGAFKENLATRSEFLALAKN